jgi:hypothetical protein
MAILRLTSLRVLTPPHTARLLPNARIHTTLAQLKQPAPHTNEILKAQQDLKTNGVAKLRRGVTDLLSRLSPLLHYSSEFDIANEQLSLIIRGSHTNPHLSTGARLDSATLPKDLKATLREVTDLLATITECPKDSFVSITLLPRVVDKDTPFLVAPHYDPSQFTLMTNLGVKNSVSINNVFKKPDNYREGPFNFNTSLKSIDLGPPLERLVSTEDEVLVIDNTRCLHDGITKYQSDPNTSENSDSGTRVLCLIDIVLQ